MIPLSVWDLPEERAKKTGMARAESANHTNVRLARAVAKELCAGGRVICADDVRVALAERHPEALESDGKKRNWLGSVFQTEDFRPVGMVRSKTPGSHGNLIRTWTLVCEQSRRDTVIE